MDKRIADISDPKIITPADGCTDLFFRLFNSMYDGVCIFEVCGTKVKALYLNERYFQVVGYTREQYLPYYDNITITLFEEDEKRIFEKAYECLEKGTDFFCEVRGYRFDQSVGWFCVRARAVDFIKSDNPVFLASINDITEQKKTEHMLSLNTERSRILEETSTAFLLDYDWVNDTMTFSPARDRENIVIPAYTSYLRRESCPIYDEDVIYYCKVLFNVCRKQGKEVVDVRSLNKKLNEYSICRIIFSSIADEYGSVFRVVGRIEEIDERSGLIARLAADRSSNSIAGLPDSESALSVIRHRLSECHSRCFMAVADLDDFTEFNKKYGKAAADNAILLAAELIKKTFPENAVIYRYVSDDFVIFLEDITESALYDMVDKLRAACQTAMLTLNGESKNAVLSFSVGAAWTVCRDKVNIKDFFITADRALIKAKKECKGSMYVEKITY
ncbi:MAG: sensor domain-containing diguanylate cyclase [Oscillospiraceae bacterium]|nr:sensor domain-containing diguanylate cyclase [Oscillospiraceae bacterium]